MTHSSQTPLSKADTARSSGNKLFTAALITSGIMLLASVALVPAGFHYIESYQAAHSGCPTYNPFTTMIFCAGFICLVGLILDTVLAFKSKRIGLAIGLIVATIASAIILLFCWFASGFCLTF